MFFTINYRFDNLDSEYEDVIESRDIETIIKASIFGSFFLLPFISEPLSSYLGNEYVRESEVVVVVRKRRALLRSILYIMNLLGILLLPIGAIFIS